MRPDRPGVVAQRVVAGLPRAERANAPAGVELLVEQEFSCSCRLALIEDPGPQQVSDVRCQAVDSALVAVEREGVASALFDPEVPAKPRPQVGGALLESPRHRFVAPYFAGQARR